jgi:hypothetical protein
MLLDPLGWRIRGTIAYGQRGDRRPERVRWEFSSQLLRVDAKFPYIRPTWNVSGWLIQEFDGLQSSARSMPFTSKLALMAKCSQYSIIWQPVQWLTPGVVRFWEYVLPLSDDDLFTLSQFEGFRSTMPVIINPVARAANSRENDKPVTTASAIIAAAAPSRVGGSVFNRSAVATLFVEFGDVAFPNSVHRVAPGGLLDIPISWVGNVAGIWDKADANGKCTVVELLA